MSADEEWRLIPGYPDYEVSDLGRVRSIRFGRFLKPSAAGVDGYVTVQPRRDGQGRNITVHVLVALAFLGPRPAGQHIRHLDGVPTNNKLTNLAYGTPSENTMDAVQHGTHRNARKTECVNGHPFDEVNTWVKSPGRRVCLTCSREYVRRYRARRARAAA